MKVFGSRFPHYNRQLLHLRKNLYLSRSDPLYFEKIIQYVDADSPEAHYRVGEKYERRGNRARAAEHYLQCLQNSSSKFIILAAQALERLNMKFSASDEMKLDSISQRKSQFPLRLIAFLLGLVVMLCIQLIFFTLWKGSIFEMASKLKFEDFHGGCVSLERATFLYICYLPPKAKGVSQK